MPTYEYACRICDDHLEVVQSFADDPLTECPSCAGELRKVFSPVGIAFKGSGFYKTDTRSSGKSKSKTSARSDSASASSDSSSSSSSSDSSGSTSTSTKTSETSTSSNGSSGSSTS